MLRDTVLHHFTYLYSKESYDYKQNKVAVGRLLEQGKEFGGYDTLTLWHQYPRLGVDARSQWDFFDDYPGGTEGLRDDIALAHQDGVKVFLPYKPMQTSRFPTPGQTVEGFGFNAFHGGKGSNQAVECARQGAQVSLIACLGDDIYGRQALELYKTEQVDSSAIRVVKERGTGVGFIVVETSGENEIIIDPGANSCLCPTDIQAQESLIASSQALLIQLEIPNEPVFEALALAKAHGVPTILNPAPFRQLPAAALSMASLITPNETEARLLLGLSPTQSIDTKLVGLELAKLGSGRSVITLGGRGALITDHDKQELIPPFHVEPVDTTGAGDTFTAALAVSLTQGATLKEAARFAAAAAAISVTRYGVIESMPTRAETLAMLQ